MLGVVGLGVVLEVVLKVLRKGLVRGLRYERCSKAMKCGHGRGHRHWWE